MSVGPAAGLSSAIMTWPLPRQSADTKIQPARGRENLKALAAPPMAATSSSSLVTLLSFFSPAKRTSAARAGGSASSVNVKGPSQNSMRDDRMERRLSIERLNGGLAPE